MRPPFLTTATTAALTLLLTCLSALAAVCGAEPTAEDMEHGRKQVQLMLLDRPGMVVYRLDKDARAGYVTPSDPMYQWAQAAFAGKYVGQRILWDRRLLPERTDATYTAPSENEQPYTISVNDQTGVSHQAFDRMWAALFYEMRNLTRAAERTRIEDDAAARRITVEDYIKQNVLLHWHIQDEQEKFYETDWLPWASALGMEHNRNVWIKKRPATFDEWFASTLKKAPSPWLSHYKYYEALRPQAKPPATTTRGPEASSPAPPPSTDSGAAAPTR
ncbi:hypothetical protein [Verrucomicrobium sp. BvORR106]|uniref:hypothetical protein n=1 Tax=Verrucomicrobium sp. BvORR106 TaxID=1403819 RepID=UPI00224100AB|nr:hypothetical protein [Verrucomicrobium sp. BvORR106]